MHVVSREVVVDAAPETVWSVVTEPEQIALWFADRAEVELRPGGAGTFVLCGEEVPIVVERVEPPRRFSFRWLHPAGEDPQAGNSVLVEFTLVPLGSGTRLRVVETGLDELGWPADRVDGYTEDHTSGWTRYLDALVAVTPRTGGALAAGGGS